VSSRSHMGIGFELWNGQRTWFWYVVYPRRNGGAIGVAANEADAIREARSSIEEMLARHRAGAAASPVIGKTAAASAIEEANPIKFAANGWNESLAKLDCYLIQVCDQFL
jgi:hypothetical protein